MALDVCRECGKDVSTEAQMCPHCGVPVPVQSVHDERIREGFRQQEKRALLRATVKWSAIPLALILVLALSGLWAYGTLSPCSMLKKEMRRVMSTQTDDLTASDDPWEAAGAAIGARLGYAYIDNEIETLSPFACATAIVRVNFGGDPEFDGQRSSRAGVTSVSDDPRLSAARRAQEKEEQSQVYEDLGLPTLYDQPLPAEGAEPALRVEDGPVYVPRDIEPGIRNADRIQILLRRIYPSDLREQGIGGMTTLWLLVNEEGQVAKTEVRRSSGHVALDEAALAIADSMRFTPAFNHNAPTAVWVLQRIDFKVKN